MLPSNSSPHPFSYSDQPFDFESNPTSNQETINCDEYFSNLSFFHFPNSPFEDYQFSHDFLLDQFQQYQTDNLLLAEPEPEPEPQPIVNNMEEEEEEEIMGVSSIKKITKVPRKKRDRHSKINTARGLRDPRMRLSLKVAKRFFRLQDMLGFEKASKTVEWLLNQAKEEINHVAAAKSSVSSFSTSECEGLSCPEEVVRKPPGVKRRTKTHSSRKFIARECREKARERARERTKQKMMRSKLQCELEATTNHKLSQLGSCKSLNHPSLDLVTNARELISSTSLSEKHLGTGEATVHDDRFFGYYYYEQKEHHHFFHEFSE